jgi:hypothetical protein
MFLIHYPFQLKQLGFQLYKDRRDRWLSLYFQKKVKSEEP